MALDLSKYNFFKRLDARARIVVLVVAALTVLLIVYAGTRWLIGSAATLGPSRVATAPSGLVSVQGGELTPEYQRALNQQNVQRTEQATMTGGTAVLTMINPGEQGMGSGQCNIICSDQLVKINSSLEDWVKQGKVTPDVAAALIKLADSNVSVEEFASFLDQLVKQGKLTPEQARELLAQYKKQHANALLQESATVMDAMIRAGQLPLEAANDLLTAQKDMLNPAEYANRVQRLVNDGKLSAASAQQLMSQYNQQYAKELAKKGVAGLQKMASSGQITPEVLADLTNLVNQNASVDTMSALLKKYVAEGKMTPAVADKILADFKKQRSQISCLSPMEDLVRGAEQESYAELEMLTNTKQITPEVAATLRPLIEKNVTFEEFKVQVENLVKTGKLSPDIAPLQLEDYSKVTRLRAQLKRLEDLQLNNVSNDQFATELKNAVAAGIFTPEQAAKMMQQCIDLNAKVTATSPIIPSAGAAQFAALQQKIKQGEATATTTQVTGSDFNVAQTQADQQFAAERQARIDALTAAMSGQAAQLVASWTPTPMRSFGSTEVRGGKDGKTQTASSVSQTTTTTTTGPSGPGGPPLIKAGTILFAVLDTAINSDYPSSPVLATIVQGQYRGAKLLGKITTSKGVTGQMDRVMLNFTVMNRDEWDKSKSVTAYAIDPDTARTMLASDVDYHYMMRFGAIFATSFVQGYANAIQSSGSTITSGFFGPNVQRPALSPSEKLATAIGQIGQNLGSVTQKYVERPPTVKVDSGVGLGILFMTDVS